MRGLGILWIVCLWGSVAFAEDTKNTINDFGLPGTWSVDCSKDLTKEFGSRVIFSVPMFGSAKVHVVVNNSITGHKTFPEVEITGAVRITEDKLKLFEGGPIDGPNTMIGVLEKIGPKIRTLDWKRQDGAMHTIENGASTRTGVPEEPLERCLN